MKNTLCLNVALIFVLSSGVALAKDVKLLKKSDVKAHLPQTAINRGEECSVDKIIGIYQRENSATIYYVVTCKKYTSMGGDFISYQSRGKAPSKKKRTTNLIRFNSGKWYNTEDGTFVAK